jgi:hypothetical protein
VQYRWGPQLAATASASTSRPSRTPTRQAGDAQAPPRSGRTPPGSQTPRPAGHPRPPEQAPPGGHPRRTPHRADQPRLFHLVRDTDPSGISGTGIVAEGCLFTSGKVALNWRSEVPSTGVYDHIDDVRLVHGHNGASHIEWLT